MNTKIEYNYRDGANYKQDGQWILTGPATEEQVERLKEACFNEDDHLFFVPDIVGIPALQPEWSDDIDHALHSITDIIETEEDADDNRDIEDLIDEFVERDWEDEGVNVSAQRRS